MSRFILMVIAALVLISGASSAEARHRRAAAHSDDAYATTGWFTAGDMVGEPRRAKRHAQQRSRHSQVRKASLTGTGLSFGTTLGTSVATSLGGHSAGGRPSKWCGWYMRTQLGGGPEYNVAANWRRYGSPTGPQVGAVVIWPHHVGIITGQASNGQWIVKSGNDGHRVRERPRSVAGAQFRI